MEKKGLEWDGLEWERLERMGFNGLFFVSAKLKKHIDSQCNLQLHS